MSNSTVKNLVSISGFIIVDPDAPDHPDVLLGECCIALDPRTFYLNKVAADHGLKESIRFHNSLNADLPLDERMNPPILVKATLTFEMTDKP